MVAGALFGRWVGTGVVSIASTLGATLAFLGSRYVLRDWVQRRFADRLGQINQGIERDGAYYLFTLRLVPVVPFFLINLGMGLTPIRVTTFAGVSWLGMLMGTFLYVNAGTELATFDSPADFLSWKVLGSLALLGVVPLAVRKLIQWKVRWRTVGLSGAGMVLVAVVGLGVRTHFRYKIADTMELAVREYTNAEYPEDPANRSLHHGQYDGRGLTLVKKDATHFDFVFGSDHPHIARVAFRDVDVSLFSVNPPAWAKDDPGILRIAPPKVASTMRGLLPTSPSDSGDCCRWRSFKKTGGERPEFDMPFGPADGVRGSKRSRYSLQSARTWGVPSTGSWTSLNSIVLAMAGFSTLTAVTPEDLRPAPWTPSNMRSVRVAYGSAGKNSRSVSPIVFR